LVAGALSLAIEGPSRVDITCVLPAMTISVDYVEFAMLLKPRENIMSS